MSIDPLGNVYQSGQAINRLKIVSVEDKQSLHLTEGGFVLSGANPLPVAEVKVVPEFLEETNSKAITGMTDMMRVTRSYEAVAQTLSQRSEHISRAINFLGK